MPQDRGAAPRRLDGGFRLLVRDFILEASIGVYDREKAVAQRIRVSVATVARDGFASAFRTEAACDLIRSVVASGHFVLAETLAERLAEGFLALDLVKAVRIRVEKLDIFPDAIVGVEIDREPKKKQSEPKIKQ